MLGPPLRGDRWVAADGCCTARRHVFATQPYDNGLLTAQRFAIDWERLDAHGRLWTGNPKVLTNWAAYGAPILAVANGAVVRAIDGIPDQVPGAGEHLDLRRRRNAVYLWLRDGGIVFYAHIRQRRPDLDEAIANQPIARLGRADEMAAAVLALQPRGELPARSRLYPSTAATPRAERPRRLARQHCSERHAVASARNLGWLGSQLLRRNQG